MKFQIWFYFTYVGINGGGNPWPAGLPGGAGGWRWPPDSETGLLGTAGAGRPAAGGGGGPLDVGIAGCDPVRLVFPATGLGGDTL